MLYLKQAIPHVLEATVISNRDKGLAAADSILGPGVYRTYCCFHLHAYFKGKFGFKLTDCFFWKIANATTEKYNTQLNLIKEQKPSAAKYLDKIDRTLWITAFFRDQRFGQNTSNIVESYNQTIRLDRKLPIIELLNEIWHTQIALRFKRSQQASDVHYQFPFTIICNTQAEIGRTWAYSNTVRMTTKYDGNVQQHMHYTEQQGKT